MLALWIALLKSSKSSNLLFISLQSKLLEVKQHLILNLFPKEVLRSLNHQLLSIQSIIELDQLRLRGCSKLQDINIVSLVIMLLMYLGYQDFSTLLFMWRLGEEMTVTSVILPAGSPTMWCTSIRFNWAGTVGEERLIILNGWCQWMESGVVLGEWIDSRVNGAEGDNFSVFSQGIWTKLSWVLFQIRVLVEHQRLLFQPVLEQQLRSSREGTLGDIMKHNEQIIYVVS